MAVSKGRVVLNLVLLLILFGILGLGYLGWKYTQPESLWDRAQTAIEDDRKEDAKKHLQTLLQKDARHAEAHFALAKLYVEEARAKDESAHFGNVPPALDHLKTAAELQPKNADIQKTLLVAYLQTDRTEQAGKVADLVLKLEPANKTALYARAEARISDKELKAAAEDVKALQPTPEKAGISTLWLHWRLQKAREDKPALEKVRARALAITKNPPGRITPRDLDRHGRMLEDAIAAAKDTKTAHERMEISLKLQENRAKFGKQPAYASLQANRLARSLIKAFPTVEDSDRDTRHKLLARVLDLGDAALKTGNARPDFHVDLVEIARFAGDYERSAKVTERSLKALQKAKNVEPKAVLKLRRHLATHQIELGNYKSAEPHVKALLADAEFATDGDLLAGIIALNEGRLADARKALDRANRKTASNVIVRLALAKTLLGLKDWRGAASSLQAFLRDSKKLSKDEKRFVKNTLGDDDAIRLMLVRASYAQKSPAAAEQQLQALRGAKQEPIVLALQAGYLWNAGKRDEARKAVAAARATFPDNLSLANLDAKIKHADGKLKEADRVIQGLVAKKPDDLATRKLEFLWLLRKRDYDASLKLLSSLRTKFPKQKLALMAAEAQVLLAKGDHAKAAKVAAELRKSPKWKAVGERFGALAALSSKNLKQAAALIESASGGERRAGTDDLLRGQLELQQGDSEAAAKSFATALKYERNETSAGTKTFQALMMLAAEKDPAKAEAVLAGLPAETQRQPALILAKAELQMQQGQFAKAVASVRQFEQSHEQVGPIYATRLYLSLGRVPEAFQAMQRAVQANPRSAGVRLFVAQIALQLRQYPLALSQADAGLQLAPQAPSLALVKGLAYAGLGKKAEAEAVLKDVTKKNPTNTPAWLALTGVYLRDKKVQQGLATLEAARKQLPKDTTILSESIVQLVRAKKPADAKAVANAFAGKSPEFVPLAVIARAYIGARDFDSAKAWGQKARAAAKTDDQRLAADLLLADLPLSEARLKDNDPKLLAAARDLYAAIHKRYPDNALAANNLSWLLATQFGDPAAALKVLQPTLKKYTLGRLSASVIDTILTVYLSANDVAAAKKLLDDAIRLRATEPRWLTARVELALKTANLQPAIQLMQRLKTERPRSAEPPYALARLFYAQQKLRAAADELTAALQLHPNHRNARMLAIEVNSKLNDHSNVLANADAVLRIAPNTWSAYRQRAAALRASKRDADADDTLKTAQERLDAAIAAQKSPQPGLIVELSRVHAAAKRPKEQIAVLLKGLEKSPRNLALAAAAMNAHLDAKQAAQAGKLAESQFGKDTTIGEALQLGRLFKTANQNDMAERWANTAAQLAKNDIQKIEAHWLLGNIHLDRGRATGDRPHFETARDHYRNVLKMQPRHLAAANNLAWILAEKLNAAKEALMVLESYRGKTPAEKLHLSLVDTYATVYRKAGQPEAARVLLEKTIAANQKQAKLHFALGLTYVDLKRPTPATRELRLAVSLGLSEENGRIAREILRELEKQAAKSKKPKTTKPKTTKPKTTKPMKTKN